MNKQVILAALAGVASAQTPCDGPFVDEAQEALDELNTRKTAADGATADLVASLALAQTALDTSTARSAGQDLLMAPFNTALATATANKTIQTDAKAAATTALTTIDAAVTAATAAKTTANTAVTTQNGLIAAQALVMVKLDAAVTEHTAERVVMQGLLTSATTTATGAATNLTNKTAEKNLADGDTSGNRGAASGAASGTTRADVTAAAAAQSSHASTDLATDNTAYTTALGNHKTIEVARQKADLWYQKLLTACETFDATNSKLHTTGFTCGTVTSNMTGATSVATCQVKAAAAEAANAGDCKQFIFNTDNTCKCCTVPAVASRTSEANTTIYTTVGKCKHNKDTATHGLDPLNFLKAAALTTRDGLTQPATTLGLLNTARINAVEEKSLAAEHAAKVSYYTYWDTAKETEVTTLTGEETTLTGTKTTADAAQATAQTNWDTVDGQLTQALADQARGAAIVAGLNAALTPLQDDLTVKTYLEQIELDKQTVQTAAKAAADALIADLTTLETMAQETVTRATTTKTFYDGMTAADQAGWDLADGEVTANTNLIAALTTGITNATNDLAVAVADCKGLGYDRAQKAVKALMDAEAAAAAEALVVAASYADARAFSTSGETNTLCAYPAATADGQGPRPVCKDGFCCGAAQKFLKDGTKLAIETCQAETGVHTYQYYPPLPAGAPVAPTPETWRFQCISGAQKLVATATAALAASYLMA